MENNSYQPGYDPERVRNAINRGETFDNSFDAKGLCLTTEGVRLAVRQFLHNCRANVDIRRLVKAGQAFPLDVLAMNDSTVQMVEGKDEYGNSGIVFRYAPKFVDERRQISVDDAAREYANHHAGKKLTEKELTEQLADFSMKSIDFYCKRLESLCPPKPSQP